MSKLSKLKLVSNITQMSDEEMKFVIGGDGSGSHCLQSCTCSNGKKYQVSCSTSCSSMASYAC